MIARMAFASLTLCMLAALPARAENANPKLVADPKTGCQVWDIYWDPKDVISWSGGCVKGLAQGRGTLIWLNDGKEVVRYQGQYRQGKENGEGKTTWAGGGTFQGEYRNGLPNGNGTYTESNGEVYTGNWTNGCFKQGERWANAHATAEDCGFQ